MIEHRWEDCEAEREALERKLLGRFRRAVKTLKLAQADAQCAEQTVRDGEDAVVEQALEWARGVLERDHFGIHFWCEHCRRRVSTTAGTIFHRTRTPLTVWFAVALNMTSSKNGVAALTLHRILGFGSYQTVWTMLHRFRTAMVRPGRDRLAGVVEVDETFFGGNYPGTGGTQIHKLAQSPHPASTNRSSHDSLGAHLGCTGSHPR